MKIEDNNDLLKSIRQFHEKLEVRVIFFCTGTTFSFSNMGILMKKKYLLFYIDGFRMRITPLSKKTFQKLLKSQILSLLKTICHSN